MSSGTDKVIVDVFEKSSGLRCSRQSLQKDGSFNVKLAGGAYRFDFMNDTRTLLSKDLLIPDYFPGDALLFNAELELPFPVQADTLMLRNILFGFDQSIPDEQSNHYLDSLAAWLLRYPEILVSVNGYADARGSAAYNQKLSMQRAKIVADYLVRINIPSGRLQVHAFGENFPVALNCNFNGTDNPQGRSYNRRVELILQHVPSQLILIAEKKIPAHLLVLPDMP
jgi:OOP family OmpA-OmpF porin